MNFLQPVLKLREKARTEAPVAAAAATALADRHARLHPIRLELDLEAARRAQSALDTREDRAPSPRMPLEKVHL